MKKAKKIEVAVTSFGWKKHPNGGEYMQYKLKMIYRDNGKYCYELGHNKIFKAKNLTEAKKAIDHHFEQRMIELRSRRKNH
jgi:hypothetical protein